ncbi:MAG: transglycosylase [Chloroflexota bacterium]|nr:transglycosylase [Chloroflexota bacterium]
MTITLTQLLIWALIAIAIGFVGELLARRRAPDGIIGAAVVGFLAIFILVGLLHFHIPGEPFLYSVPLLSSIIVAAILVLIWSRFAYHRVHPYASRYYRRGSYVRRPRSRRRWL